MPTSQYEDEDVQELCDIIKKIIEEEGKRVPSTFILLL
jgi:hypothetical protein